MQTIDTPCLPEALLNTRHTHAVHTAYLVALLSMSLGGCATVKVPEPIGGSRADATVDLGFEFGQFEKPVINWDIAGQKAVQRCAVWGYSGAEKFGLGKTNCQFTNQYGCARTTVTVTYQCTGAGVAATTPPTPKS